MNEELKKQVIEDHNKVVDWYKKNFTPEEIYNYTELLFHCCEFFIRKWSEWVDIKEEMEKDELVKKYMTSIIQMRYLQMIDYKDGVKVDIGTNDNNNPRQSNTASENAL